MFFKRKRKKEEKILSKELLSYEDGEVISVGIVEKDKVSDTTNSKNLFSKVEDLKKRVSVFFRNPKKFIKYLLFIFIGIIILLILLDLFNILSASKEQDSTAIIDEHIEYPLDKGHSSNRVEDLAGSDSSPLVNINDNDLQDWKQLFNATERANNILTTLSSEEIGLYQQYKDKKINRLALERKLGRSLDEKEKIVRYFQFHEQGFKSHDLGLLYAKTTERNQASVEFTRNLISMISSYNKSIQEEIDNYIERDDVMASEQNFYISTFFSSENLDYVYDESTGYFFYD